MVSIENPVMVNFIKIKGVSKDRRPKKRRVLSTLALLFCLFVAGAVVAALFAAAGNIVPTAVPVTSAAGAVAGSVFQYRGRIGWFFNRLIQDVLRPFRIYIDPTGRILIGAVWGALGTGMTAAFCVLHFHGQLFDLRWLTESGTEFPHWLFGGGLCGTALGIFRKIIMKRKTWADWTIDDLFVVRYENGKKVKRQKRPNADLDLSNVLQECPVCHRKQDVKNQRCSCGEDLDRSKKSERTKYWIQYTTPDGKQHRSFVGNSIELAARHATAQRKKTGAYKEGGNIG